MAIPASNLCKVWRLESDWSFTGEPSRFPLKVHDFLKITLDPTSQVMRCLNVNEQHLHHTHTPP